MATPFPGWVAPSGRGFIQFPQIQAKVRILTGGLCLFILMNPISIQGARPGENPEAVVEPSFGFAPHRLAKIMALVWRIV
jgi:hypothetical protein